MKRRLWVTAGVGHEGAQRRTAPWWQSTATRTRQQGVEIQDWDDGRCRRNSAGPRSQSAGATNIAGEWSRPLLARRNDAFAPAESSKGERPRGLAIQSRAVGARRLQVPVALCTSTSARCGHGTRSCFTSPKPCALAVSLLSCGRSQKDSSIALARPQLVESPPTASEPSIHPSLSASLHSVAIARAPEAWTPLWTAFSNASRPLSPPSSTRLRHTTHPCRPPVTSLLPTMSWLAA